LNIGARKGKGRGANIYGEPLSWGISYVLPHINRHGTEGKKLFLNDLPLLSSEN
jgi:hypothetical protein